MTDTHAVKFVDGSSDTIEGWLAPYGGPEYLGGKDWHGEFFSPSTDFALDWFGDWQRPLLYQHGLDDTLKTEVVGRISVTPKDKGLWMRAQLDASHEYHDEIAALVADGALGASSGSVSHLVQRDRKSGEIKRWPLIEGSLTPTPANPLAEVGYAIKHVDAVAHLAVIGTEMPILVGDHGPENFIPLKAGRRNSASDQAALQNIHDLVCQLGAMCAEDMADGEEDTTALASKSDAAPTAPEPAAMFAIKASEPVANADDIAAAKAVLTDLARQVATELLR